MGAFHLGIVVAFLVLSTRTANLAPPVQPFNLEAWFKAFSGCHITLHNGDIIPFSSVRTSILSSSDSYLSLKLFSGLAVIKFKLLYLQRSVHCQASLVTNVEDGGKYRESIAGQRVAVAYKSNKIRNHHVHVLVPLQLIRPVLKEIYSALNQLNLRYDYDITRTVLLLKEDAPVSHFSDMGTSSRILLTRQQSAVHFCYFLLLCIACTRTAATGTRPEIIRCEDFTIENSLLELEQLRLFYISQQSFLIENSREMIILGTTETGQNLLPKSLKEVIHGINSKMGNHTIMLLRTNGTRYNSKTRDRYHQIPRILYLTPATAAGSSFILIETQQYNFVTCYTKPETGYLIHLVRPLGLAVWVLLVITCGSLLGLAMMILRINVGSMAFLLLSVLLESSTPTVSASRSAFSRFFVALIMILSLIISNGYKGSLTSEITAPPRKAMPENFDDLDGFDIYAKVSQEFTYCAGSEERLRECTVKLPNEYKTLSANEPHLKNIKVTNGVGSSFGLRAMMVMSTALKMNFSTHEEERRLFDRFFKKDIELLQRTFEQSKIAVNTGTASAEAIVSRCGKTAFLDYETDLPKFKPYSNGSWEQNFAKGKSGLMKEIVGWGVIKTNQNDNVLRTAILHLAVESGIYNWLHNTAINNTKGSLEMIWRQQEIHEKRTTRNRKLSFESRLVKALFTLYAIATTVSITGFLLEMTVQRTKKYWTNEEPEGGKGYTGSGEDACITIQVRPREASPCIASVGTGQTSAVSDTRSFVS